MSGSGKRPLQRDGAATHVDLAADDIRLSREIPVADWVSLEMTTCDEYPTYRQLRDKSPAARMPTLDKYLVTSFGEGNAVETDQRWTRRASYKWDNRDRNGCLANRHPLHRLSIQRCRGTFARNYQHSRRSSCCVVEYGRPATGIPSLLFRSNSSILKTARPQVPAGLRVHNGYRFCPTCLYRDKASDNQRDCRHARR